MAIFLDVRLCPVGGGLAASVNVNRGTSLADYVSVSPSDFAAAVSGNHVLMGAHGFNVNRADGIDCLSKWADLLDLGPASVFLGILWPGDSIWAHGLDYPEEPEIANQAGRLIAQFVDAHLLGAASVSFTSHSLGARVILETIRNMSLPVRRAIVMAGAIDNNCLIDGYAAAAANVEEMSALASSKDEVLSCLFPMGNFFAGTITDGHPWYRAALGHRGPSTPKPGNFLAPYQIPDYWDFGHGTYLQTSPPPAPGISIPSQLPPQGSEPPYPAHPPVGWQQAFTAAFVSKRFQ
jgi:hypothetical protein